MSKRTYIILSVAVLFVAIYQVFTLGYGCADKINYTAEQLLDEHKAYADEHLAVIYERKMGGNTDFLHLQIDTTYHEIGKGAYKHEILCKRSYTLRCFDGKYEDMSDAVAECFISGKEWQEANGTNHGTIMGYDCYRATTTIDGRAYEAWYTTSLPHLRHGSRAADNNCGLILEAHDTEGGYTLGVRYIGEQIG